MNSRERVLLALNHQEPDQVPFDLGGTENTTIARIAYLNLRDHLGLPDDPSPYIINRQMDAVFAQDDLLRRLGVDIKAIRPSSVYRPNLREMSDNSFYDELNIRWRKASYYYDMVEHPMCNYTYDDIQKIVWPDPHAPGRMSGLREQAENLYKNSDYALIVGHITWGPFELGCALRGYSQFLIDFYNDEKLAVALLEKNLEMAINFWGAYLDEVGEFVQVVAQGDDLGMQTGPIISPKMYRKYIKPLHKQLFNFLRSKTKAKIFLHSCGSVYNMIPDLIEAGVEILSPVQFTAAKMDLAQLKKEFGKDLTFWGGGVDTQHILPEGSLDEIRDQVKQVFDIMAPGGGFVFVPVHNIQSDISPDRIMAAYDTALSRRGYPVLPKG
jgi:uroporphyrinogen decarboxylase